MEQTREHGNQHSAKHNSAKPAPARTPRNPRYFPLSPFYFLLLISTPAHSSTTLAMHVKSEAGPNLAFVTASIWRTAEPTTIGTPSASASSMHNLTSLYDSAVANPKSNVPGRIERGNLACVALLGPLPAFMMSSSTFGSRPAFTPIANPSEETTNAAAARRLFASFAVCARPGFSPVRK